MKLANCRLFVYQGHDVPGVDVTPAEVVLYRAIHYKNVGHDPVKDLVETREVERSSAQELLRLKMKYSARNKQGQPYVEVLFGGHGRELPMDFKGIYPQEVPAMPTIESDEPVVVTPPAVETPS